MLPAYAGMIPTGLSPILLARRAPRVRGDDPRSSMHESQTD